MENILINGIGKRIGNKRKEADLTQTEIAEEYGCVQSAISAIEKEDQRPSLDFLVWFSKKVKSDIEYLITGEEPQKVAYSTTPFGNGAIDTGNQNYESGKKDFDWDLHNEIATMIGELRTELSINIKPEKLGGILKMLYTDSLAGVEITRAKVIELIKLAA